MTFKEFGIIGQKFNCVLPINTRHFNKKKIHDKSAMKDVLSIATSFMKS